MDSFDFEVLTIDFALAVAGLVPHTDPKSDFVERGCLLVEPVGTGVQLQAAGLGRMALAPVTFSDGPHESADRVMVNAAELAAAVSLFPFDKKNPDEHVLQVRLDSSVIQISEAGGLFSGRSVKLNLFPDEGKFGDVAGVLGELLSGTVSHVRIDDPILHGAQLAPFIKSAKMFGDGEFTVMRGGKFGFLVRAEDRFLGYCPGSGRSDEDQQASRQLWDFWRSVLPAGGREFGEEVAAS